MVLFKRLSVSLLLFFLLLTFPAQAAIRMAIVDFVVNGASTHLGDAVGEILRTELASRGQFEIPERGQLWAVAKEHKLQISGLVDPQTAVKLGKLIGSNYVLLGAVNNLGGVFVITARVVDVQSGLSVSGFKSTASEGEAGLYEASEDLVRQTLVHFGIIEKPESIVAEKQDVANKKDETKSSFDTEKALEQLKKSLKTESSETEKGSSAEDVNINNKEEKKTPEKTEEIPKTPKKLDPEKPVKKEEVSKEKTEPLVLPSESKDVEDAPKISYPELAKGGRDAVWFCKDDEPFSGEFYSGRPVEGGYEFIVKGWSFTKFYQLPEDYKASKITVEAEVLSSEEAQVGIGVAGSSKGIGFGISKTGEIVLMYGESVAGGNLNFWEIWKGKINPTSFPLIIGMQYSGLPAHVKGLINGVVVLDMPLEKIKYGNPPSIITYVAISTSRDRSGEKGSAVFKKVKAVY